MAGLVAAFIFAVQMLNFPVAGGTSGHLLGGVLAAVLVGPYLGALCVSVVLVVQALLFADGGLSALGLNVVNMALVGAFGGYGVFLLARRGAARHPARAWSRPPAVAALLSVVLAALAFTAEYAIGGTGGASLAAVAGADGGRPHPDRHRRGADHRHSRSARSWPCGPTSCTAPATSPAGPRRPATGAAAAVGALTARHATRGVRGRRAGGRPGPGLLRQPQASSQPDGLDKVAIDEGFADQEAGHTAWRTARWPATASKGVDDDRLEHRARRGHRRGVTFAVGRRPVPRAPPGRAPPVAPARPARPRADVGGGHGHSHGLHRAGRHASSTGCRRR